MLGSYFRSCLFIQFAMLTVVHVDTEANCFCKTLNILYFATFSSSWFLVQRLGLCTTETHSLTPENDVWDLNWVQQIARRSPPMASADQQARSAGSGVTGRRGGIIDRPKDVFFLSHVPSQEKRMEIRLSSLSSRRSETVVHSS